jgi:hypothetical protein
VCHQFTLRIPVRILITTDYLRPGDAVDRPLREHGHETTHSPAVGVRAEGEMGELPAHAGLVVDERDSRRARHV